MQNARAILSALLVLAGPSLADAGSLRVAPTSLTFTAPASTGTLTLRNDGTTAINVQVRPFAWSQYGGQDALLPTRDVVVSPPITMLNPGVDYVVRVVRIVKRPVQGEEAYRVLVDELPDPARRKGNVTVLIRYSVPVFFSAATASAADVQWQINPRPNSVEIFAANLGDRHLRVANLRAIAGQGAPHSIRDGLIGYVLGRSAVSWALPVRVPVVPGQDVALVGESTEGSFHEPAAVGSTR